MREELNNIHPVDEHVGRKLKLKRVEKSLTQNQLAESIGVTFQQIQKYEKGANRISSSKLFEIAQTLQVSISYFFAELENTNYEFRNDESYVALFDSANDDYKAEIEESKDELHDLIASYISIKDPKDKKNLIEIAKSLANK